MVDDQNQSNRQMNCMENVPQNCQSTFRMEDFGFNFPPSFPCIDCSSQTQSFPMMPQGFVVLQPAPQAPPKPAPPAPPPPVQQPACASLCPMCAQIASRLLGAGTDSSPPRSCPLFSRRSEHPMFSSSLQQAHGHECECIRCSLPSKRADSALFKSPVSSSAKTSREQKYFNELNDMLDEKIDKILKPVLMTLAKAFPAQQPAPAAALPAKQKTCSCASLSSGFYKPGFCIPSKVYMDSESDSDDEEDYGKRFERQKPKQRKSRQFEQKISKFQRDEVEDDDDYQDEPKYRKQLLEPEKRTKSNSLSVPREKREIINEGMINLSATSLDSDEKDSNNRNCTTNKCNKKNVSFNKRSRQLGFKTDQDSYPLSKKTSNSSDLASTNLLKRK